MTKVDPQQRRAGARDLRQLREREQIEDDNDLLARILAAGLAMATLGLTLAAASECSLAPHQPAPALEPQP